MKDVHELTNDELRREIAERMGWQMDYRYGEPYFITPEGYEWRFNARNLAELFLMTLRKWDDSH